MKREVLYGNIWVFVVELKKGEGKASHKHEFDHLHQVIKGRAIIRVYDEDENLLIEEETKAGDYLRVPKGYYHSIEALEDYLGNCLHAVKDTDGEVLQTDFIRGIKKGELFFQPNRED